MTETQVNIPLLRKAVEWAEAEAAKPRALSQWEQNYYVASAMDVADCDEIEKSPDCGTCYCIAGFVAQAVTDLEPGTEFSMDGRHVVQVACAELGLTGEQAAPLFRWRNSIADVRRIAEDIAGERL